MMQEEFVPPRSLTPIDIGGLREACKISGAIGHRARRKMQVLERYGFKCCKCGATDFLTIAHLPGRAANNRRGASGYNPSHCYVLCVHCHCMDEDKRYHRWLQKSFKQPINK